MHYEEVRYEGYGIGGAAIIVDCMTDNRVRTVAEVRHAFSKHGGNMGTEGSVAFQFKHCGQLLFAPGTQRGQSHGSGAGSRRRRRDHRTTTAPSRCSRRHTGFEAVRNALEAAGLKPEMAEVTMRADNTIELAGEDAAQDAEAARRCWKTWTTPRTCSTTPCIPCRAPRSPTPLHQFLVKRDCAAPSFRFFFFFFFLFFFFFVSSHESSGDRLGRPRTRAGLEAGPVPASVQAVYVAPGNGGTALDPNLKNIAITDVKALRDCADGREDRADRGRPRGAAGRRRRGRVPRPRPAHLRPHARPPRSWKAPRPSPRPS